MGKYVQQLPLKSPAEMSDLYQLSFDEILDVLAALGDALDFDSTPICRRPTKPRWWPMCCRRRC